MLDRTTNILDDQTLQEVEDMAEEMNNASNGIITERQAVASILLNGIDGRVSVVRGNVKGPQVAELMGVTRSTVYTLAEKGEQNFSDAMALVQVVSDKQPKSLESFIQDNAN